MYCCIPGIWGCTVVSVKFYCSNNLQGDGSALQELAQCRKLHHPNLVQMFDCRCVWYCGTAVQRSDACSTAVQRCGGTQACQSTNQPGITILLLSFSSSSLKRVQNEAHYYLPASY